MKGFTRSLLATALAIFGILLVSMVWERSTLADVSPVGCSGSGFGISLFSSTMLVHTGDTLSFGIDVFNGTAGGSIVCDVTNIQASIVTPDGVTHPITLLRTTLSSGQVDSYANVVTYVARAQDATPAGVLNVTASDTGIIHQNIVNTKGSSAQAINVHILNDLHVVKLVVNNSGGTATSSAFSLHVKNASTGVDVLGSPAAGTSTPGTLYSIVSGTYAVSEDATSSYSSSFSGDCNASGSVTLAVGDSKTCTVTNTDIPPILHVVKLVVNTSGGTATSTNFALHVKDASSGLDVAGSPAAGASASGTLYTLKAGTFTVSEDATSSYTPSFSGDCNASGTVSLLVGDSRTCTITNTDIPPILHIVKVVVNNSGGTAVASAFSLHVKNASTSVDVSGSPAVGTGAPGTMYSLISGTYAVSEDTNAAYASSVTGDCNASGTVVLAVGDSKTCTITNTDIPPPPASVVTVPGGGGNNGGNGGGGNNGGGVGTGGAIVPVIGIVLVPDPLALPGGSGSVTYDYTVRNVGGQQPLINVTVADNTCSPVILFSGDSNNNGKLDPGENWEYRCTTILRQTTTNTATAIGHSDDGLNQTATASATATVVVGGGSGGGSGTGASGGAGGGSSVSGLSAANPASSTALGSTPGLPNAGSAPAAIVPRFPTTGFPPRDDSTPWDVATPVGIALAIVSISLAKVLRKRKI